MLCCNHKSLIVKYNRTLCRHKHIAKPRKSMFQLSPFDFIIFIIVVHGNNKIVM